MTFRITACVVFVSVLAGAAAVTAPVHRKKHKLNLPHTVTFHGLNVDLDQYKPGPVHVDMSQISALEDQERKEIQLEEDILKKVETEYLNSDLHKEALRLKYIPEDN